MVGLSPFAVVVKQCSTGCVCELQRGVAAAQLCGSWPGNRSSTTGHQTAKSRGDSPPSCFQKPKDQAQPGERLSGERMTGEREQG